MLDYIDRNLIEWYGCDYEYASCKNRECSDCNRAECSRLQIMQIPAADVVERSEYDKLKQKNIELEIEYDDVMKMNALRVTEYKQLRSKIDKAIDEMNNIDLNEYTNNAYQLVNECIRIVKTNIGGSLWNT